MSPRRLTGAEERELARTANRLKAADARAGQAREDRNQLILDLIDSGCRIVDIADILGITPKAVQDARDRARER